MYDTYKCILQINFDDLNGLQMEEVALKFQQSEDKNFRNKCFAYIFKNVFPMLLTIHHKPLYSRLTHEDKTEECLCCTLYAIEHWTPGRGYKLSSYINTVVNSGLKTMLAKITKTNKYKILSNLEPNSELVEYKLRNASNHSLESHELNLFLDDLQTSILEPDEIAYCKLLLDGYTKAPEIATNINIKELKKYNRKTKEFVTEPLNDNSLIKYCQKLRNTIKKKIIANNNEIFN